MNDSTLTRTIQWTVMVVLVFFGPLGWVLIYLLWKQWNPTAPHKKSSVGAKPKAKKATVKAPAKKSAKK